MALENILGKYSRGSTFFFVLFLLNAGKFKAIKGLKLLHSIKSNKSIKSTPLCRSTPQHNLVLPVAV